MTRVGTAALAQAEQGLVTGAVALTPIQHWFFEQQPSEPPAWNHALLLEVPSDWDAVLLEKAVTQVLQQHDTLRLRFVREATGWQQFHAGLTASIPLTYTDLSHLSEPEQQITIETVATKLQASLRLEEGLLIKLALFGLGADRPKRVFITIHSLAIDGSSWPIVLEDLQIAYEQLAHNEAIQLPAKSSAFQLWAEKLVAHAQSAVVREELDYWLSLPWTQIARLPVDDPQGTDANSTAVTQTVSVALNMEKTQALLQEVPQAYHTQTNDVLLTALGEALTRWAGTRCVLIGLDGNGREMKFEGIDVSRTVGCFSTTYPAVLDLGDAFQPGETLTAVKEQLRRIPNQGMSYGLLRYLSTDPDLRKQLQGLPQTEVFFHCIEQPERSLPDGPVVTLAAESSSCSGRWQSIQAGGLSINACITAEQLYLDWYYNAALYSQSTVESLAHDFIDALHALIDHCRSPEAGGFTPSDFPLANLDQQQLDQLSEVLGKLDDG